MMQILERRPHGSRVHSPLGFVLRLLWAIPVLAVGTMLVPASDDLKFKIFLAGVCAVLALAALVAAPFLFRQEVNSEVLTDQRNALDVLEDYVRRRKDDRLCQETVLAFHRGETISLSDLTAEGDSSASTQ